MSPTHSNTTILIISVCMVESGAIFSVLSYCGIKWKVERSFQIGGIGLVSIGTIFGFWSVLTNAGEKGLFFPLMGVLLIVTEIALVIVSLTRTRVSENDEDNNQYESSQAATYYTVLFHEANGAELSYHCLKISQ